MQIHNDLTPVQRARTTDALDAVAANLAKCTPSPYPSGDEHLFTLENGGGDVETLRVWLRNHEMRVFVVVRRDGRPRRTTFVEHLREDRPAGMATVAEAVARLSDWRRYVDAIPSEEASLAMSERRSVVATAAVGAASRLDEHWRTLWVSPAFDAKPPLILLGDPSGETSAFRARDSDDGSFGTMSDELVRELSIMSDHMFVTTSKPISNPGFQVDFGPLPSIRIVNDLSPMDLLHAMLNAEKLGLRMLPPAG